MSISSEIARISGNVEDAFEAIEGKGVTVPSGSTSDDLADLISQISSGGGGSGLVYETGEYIPSTDVARPTISFSGTHNKRPFCAVIIDSDGSTLPSANSVMYWTVVSFYDLFGTAVYPQTSTSIYGRTQHTSRSSNSHTTSGSNLQSITGTNSSLTYYLIESSFNPYAGTDSRYFRSGRTYKWIAVWAPTT